MTCLGLAVFSLEPAAAATASQEKKFVAPITKKPARGTRVNVVADRLTYNGRSKIAVATGTVRITYGPYVLTATKVTYDMAKGRFKANGSVELKEPNGNILQADLAEMNDRFAEGFAEHVRALLNNDVTLTAQYARRYEDGITVYERATYTACKTCVDEGGEPLWQFVSEQVTHDEGKKTLYHRNPRLEIGGVPVFWSPYLAMPDPTVKRRTGLLIPSFNYGSTYGFGATTPYFWNIAPNKDLTFSPVWTTKQGPVADVEWRHRLSDGMYSVRGYGVYQLDRNATNESDRWRGGLTTRGDFRIDTAWTWGWDGTLVGDKTFLDDYDFDTRNIATSSLFVTGLADRNYANAQLQNNQALIDEIDQDVMPSLLPFVSASYIFDTAILGGEVQLDFNAYSLYRDDIDTQFGLATEQTRAVTNLNWRSQYINDLGQVITPFAQMRGDIYITENLPGAASPQKTTGRFLPSAGIDTRWPFLSANSVGQSVLTPVFQLIAAPDEPDENDISDEDAVTLNFDHSNIFLSDRFTGYDRYEGGVRANAGLVYDFFAGNGGFVKVSLGESFHIAGENSFVAGSGLNGTASDLVSSIVFQPNDYISFVHQTRFEEDLSRVNVHEASASLSLDRISASLSYADVAAAPAYGRDTREVQVWGDASYRLTEAWRLFGGFRYDLEDDSFVDKAIGLAFLCDCMNAALTYSEHDEVGEKNDHRIELSVELRTIGAIDGGFRF